ncbi:FUSC family protein [Nocardia sp. CA-290969]|uniref:FUSC family protein n=1 Tax=Nocardia sp. CA-290969 TaxID=3239986 RepID=UPI003D8C5E35
MGVPLFFALATGSAMWVPYLALGSLAALYSKNDPYRRRAQVLAWVGAALVAAVVLGVWSSSVLTDHHARLIVVAVFAALAKLLCDVARSGPPGGLIIGFACATTAFLPPPVPSLAVVFVACLSGAMFAWCVCMFPWLFDPHGPTRVAVARALRNVAKLSLPAADDGRARQEAALQIYTAWTALSASARRRPQSRRTLAVMTARAESFLLRSCPVSSQECRELLKMASHIRFSPRLTFLPTQSERDEIEGLAMEARAAAAAHRIRFSAFRAIRAACRPSSAEMPGAARVFCGCLLAGGVALAVGAGHSYWAAVTAIAILQVSSRTASLHRLIQRIAGTMAGLAICMAVMSSVSSPFVLAAVIVACMVLGEMLVVRNYGYGMILITPTAILLVTLATPGDAWVMTRDRWVDTLIGAAAGVVCAVVVRNRRAFAVLEQSMRRCRNVTETKSPPLDDESRWQLVLELGSLRAAYEVSKGEYPARDLPTDELLRIERRGHELLASSG